MDLGDLEDTSILPGARQLVRVRLPIKLQCGLDLRRGPIEASGDVLLAIGDKIGLGVPRIDGDVHAKPESRRFRDVLHNLHLRAVVTHTVDVEARRRFGDIGRNAVDQTVLAALGAVDELEAAVGIGARKRA